MTTIMKIVSIKSKIVIFLSRLLSVHCSSHLHTLYDVAGKPNYHQQTRDQPDDITTDTHLAPSFLRH